MDFNFSNDFPMLPTPGMDAEEIARAATSSADSAHADLAQIMAQLSRFNPESILDARGRRWTVLAAHEGGEDLPEGGFAFRIVNGGIGVSPPPTTSDYQTALINAYTVAEITPARGDLVVLRVTAGSRLVARFLILDDDQAAPTATVSFTIGTGPEAVTYYGLNLNYVSLESLVEGLQDALAGPNGGQEPDGRDIEPEGTAPFAISVNGIYDTDASDLLVPAAGSPTIGVNAGTVAATDDINATASAASTAAYAFPGSDGITYVHIYLKVTIALTGPGGTPASATAEIEHRTTNTAGVPPVSEVSFVGTDAIRYFTIGVVALARRGNRRYARITQAFAGNLKAYADGSGSNTLDANGVNTAAGLREVVLCVNGTKPYKTHILTGPLTEIT